MRAEDVVMMAGAVVLLVAFLMGLLAGALL